MAQKFKSTPVEIEAVQWDGTAEGATSIIDWVLSNGGTARYFCTSAECSDKPHVLLVETLEGDMTAGPNWWIIRGLEGEFYPCKDSVFRKKYEAV